jgi:hypothetical protein
MECNCALNRIHIFLLFCIPDWLCSLFIADTSTCCCSGHDIYIETETLFFSLHLYIYENLQREVDLMKALFCHVPTFILVYTNRKFIVLSELHVKCVLYLYQTNLKFGQLSVKIFRYKFNQNSFNNFEDRKCG